MKVLWCDREEGNTPSFKMMRAELKRVMGNDVTFAYATRKFDMPNEYPNHDACVIGPFSADLDAWGNLDKYDIPKIMIISDPHTDLPAHHYWAKRHKIQHMWFLYPSWIPFYQRYMPDMKYDSLPWWLDDIKTDMVKDVDLAYGVALTPLYPIRRAMNNDARLVKMGRKFGRGDVRLEYKDYSNLLNKAKILAFDSSFWNIPILKYVEGMCMECCVLAPTPEASRVLGIKEYENIVPITAESYYKRIRRYLHDDGERRRIASNGRKTFLEMHTTEIRARQIVEKMRCLTV